MGVGQNLNSAASIGRWVSRELSSPRPEPLHAVRVITREIDRWFNNELATADIAELAAEPVDTGDRRWDALIEGIVARKLHERRMVAPSWTRRTRLEVGWHPYEDVIRDPDWYRLDVFRTPVELLDKGVIFPREELQLS